MTRAKVLACIRSTPGIGIRALMQRMKLGHAALRDIIGELEEEEQVVSVADGGRRRLFPRQAGIDECWQQILVMRDEHLLALYNLLFSRPSWRQRDVVARARELWDWHPNTTRNRISKLADAGLLSRESIISREQSLCLLVKPIEHVSQEGLQRGTGISGTLPVLVVGSSNTLADSTTT